MSCLEVVVRTDGVPAGLHTLPADGVGCPEAQPEVLLLQRKRSQVSSASVWAPCWHPGARQGPEHPWVLWEEMPPVHSGVRGHIHGTVVVWMPPLPPPRVPLVVDELGKTPMGFPRPKGTEDTTPHGSWVGAGDPRTPSSALPSQVA